MRLKSQNYKFKSENYMENYFCQIRKKFMGYTLLEESA